VQWVVPVFFQYVLRNVVVYKCTQRDSSCLQIEKWFNNKSQWIWHL